MKAVNPFAFRPGPVTFWTTIVYLAVIIPLIYVQETVPSAPSQRKLPDGVNLTEAWHDLQTITKSFHPYNSHENDRVREYLMARAKEILERNKIDYTTELTGGVPWSTRSVRSQNDHASDSVKSAARQPGATVFDDRISNITYAAQPLFNGSFVAASPVVGQYFEGNNFYVYIHGKDDPEGHWWQSESPLQAARSGAGVLVNCHFDSVATGFGATDDGMSCISLLQMLSHFTYKGHQPKSGIVLLFNNAEEDGLLGARAFGYSPLVQFCHSFVNLEGAGAGGRAMLFRTTDLETAKAYAKTPYPLGSVVAANAFEKGFIRSGTDYSVFVEEFGQRGLDIAFYAPRSRYHTGEDDARHTSKDSIWHMLSAAMASTDSLSKSTESTFNGPRSDHRKDLVQNGRPTDGVWFDWFGRAWATLPLRGLFAWSLTLLITTPLILAVVTFLLVRKDKYYFFSKDVDMDDVAVSLGGWKGLVRFPFALAVAGALTIGSVYLVGKINPLIVYSSGYAIWAMMMSVFYFSFWLIARGASFVRPSALQRGYALIWLFILVWILHVGAAVAEDRMNVGGVYFVAFLHSSVFLCLLITLLEQFSLPSKQDFASQPGIADEEDESSGNRTNGQSNGRSNAQNEDDGSADTPTETTPLRAGEQSYGANDQPTTFASTYRRSVSESREAAADSSKTSSFEPYGNEQAWSARLPGWTWLLQLLLLAPVHLIILGNLGLVMTTAMSMTGTDGSGLLAPLMGIGVLSILLLLPLTPFIHRITHHVPLFLLLVFIGTLIYNLVAFPFSMNNRFKFTFQQVIDIDQGTNVVSLLGLEEFVRPVAASMPSVAGQRLACDATGAGDLKNCQYDGSHVVPDLADGEKLENLISIEAATDGARSITVKLDAINTRSCFLDFSSPVYEFSVDGGSKRDERFGAYPHDGLKHIQLWRRQWEGGWTVNIELGDDTSSAYGDSLDTIEEEDYVLVSRPGDEELKRRAPAVAITARCVWSDANEASTIPALDEVKKYMPSWSIVAKKSVGLVEVKKTVKVV